MGSLLVGFRAHTAPRLIRAHRLNREFWARRRSRDPLRLRGGFLRGLPLHNGDLLLNLFEVGLSRRECEGVLERLPESLLGILPGLFGPR